VNGVKENILLGGAMFVLPTKKEMKLGKSAVLLSATPQGEMFPEVSHPPALLGSLVSIS